MPRRSILSATNRETLVALLDNDHHPDVICQHRVASNRLGFVSSCTTCAEMDWRRFVMTHSRTPVIGE